MTLDEKMKIWEERSNDEFGTILQAIREATKDYFYEEEDEYGIAWTPISNYITEYSLDGNRKYTAKGVKYTLENWDIIGNDEAVDSLIKDLENLI